MTNKRLARLVAGTTLAALLGGACAAGGGSETEVSVAPAAHGMQHTTAFAAADPNNPVDLLREVAGHMPGLATTIVGAIDKQKELDGDVTDGAAKLRQTLTAALQEHEYLAGIAVAMAAVTKDPNSGAFKAAAAALDKNSVALAEAVDGIYPGTKDTFLASWRKHIGFFVDYTLGKITGDAAKVDKARTDLDGYRQDFGALLESLNPNLPKAAVAEALIPHVNGTFDAIDAVVAGDGTGFEKLRLAAGHMPMLANTLAGAIAKQKPETFTGNADSAVSGSLSTVTAALQEHEYLAGIAIVFGVLNGIDSPEFEAAAAALDKNSVALATVVDSVYPGTKDTFLASWRKHIGFFVDYTVGKATNDTAKADKARADLDGYRQDFGALLESVNPNLPKAAVAEALIPHVNGTFAAIDAVVATSGAPAAAASPQAETTLPRTH